MLAACRRRVASFLPPARWLPLLLAAAAAAGPRSASAQLGCPMLGCDGRGLFYQADISLGKQATKLWSVQTAGVPQNASLGCVGNDNNAVCFAGAVGRPRALVAIDLTNGSEGWTETKLTDPGLPIMNIEGDVIGADGNCMVYVYANGTYLGAECFEGHNGLVSSLLLMKHVGQFFYVSRESGLLALFGTDGVCTATMQLLDKSNGSTYIWIPVNQPVLGDGCAYVVAKRNTSDDPYRLYAISFNDQPPYLSVKWYYDLAHGQPQGDMNATRMLSYDGFVALALPQSLLWLQDGGGSASSVGQLALSVSSMALYDVDAVGRAAALSTIVWLAVTGDGPCDAVYGVDFDNPLDRPAYNWSLCDVLAVDGARITSRIGVFGYHADEQVLVAGVTVSVPGVAGGSGRGRRRSRRRFDGFAPGASNYVVALAPVDATRGAVVLWAVASDSNDHVVRGQLVGVRSQYIVAHAGSDREGAVLCIG